MTSLLVMDDKTAPHDRIRRILFSHHQLVEDLLRHFVAEDSGDPSWLADLDFTTLRREHESTTEARRGRSLYRDVVWSIRRRSQPEGQPLYVVILIEFQSSVGWFMVLRKMAYMAFFYQDLVKARKLKPGDWLPAILPVVLYNGDRAWRAPASIDELIGPVPEPLRKYQPQFRYLLLDEQNSAIRLGSERNTVAGWMALERSRTPEDVLAASSALDCWLQDPEDDELREAFALLLHQRLPEHLFREQNPLDLKETTMGVRENLQLWREEYAQEIGREQRTEGRREGQRSLLEKQLRLKFGPLPTIATERLAQADMVSLDLWAGRVLTAGSLDEIWR